MWTKLLKISECFLSFRHTNLPICVLRSFFLVPLRGFYHQQKSKSCLNVQRCSFRGTAVMGWTPLSSRVMIIGWSKVLAENGIYQAPQWHANKRNREILPSSLSFLALFSLPSYKVSVSNCGSRSSPSPGKNRAVQPLGHITSVFASFHPPHPWISEGWDLLFVAVLKKPLGSRRYDQFNRKNNTTN